VGHEFPQRCSIQSTLTTRCVSGARGFSREVESERARVGHEVSTTVLSIQSTRSRRGGCGQAATDVQYVVQITTGRSLGAGTDADVTLELLGDQSDTWWRCPALGESIENPSNPFERGYVDTFEVCRPRRVRGDGLPKVHRSRVHTRAISGWQDRPPGCGFSKRKGSEINWAFRGGSGLQVWCPQQLGALVKARVGHDGSGLMSDWQLAGVQVTAPGSAGAWSFPCRSVWVKKNKPVQLSVEALVAPDK
jgi:hypothetical protein